MWENTLDRWIPSNFLFLGIWREAYLFKWNHAVYRMWALPGLAQFYLPVPDNPGSTGLIFRQMSWPNPQEIRWPNPRRLRLNWSETRASWCPAFCSRAPRKNDWHWNAAPAKRTRTACCLAEEFVLIAVAFLLCSWNSNIIWQSAT